MPSSASPSRLSRATLLLIGIAFVLLASRLTTKGSLSTQVAPVPQDRFKYSGLNQYHIHDDTLEATEPGKVIGNADDESTYVIVSQSPSASQACIDIAKKTQLTNTDLFYLNFHKVTSPLVPLEVLSRWVEEKCIGTYIEVQLLTNSDSMKTQGEQLSKEKEYKSKIEALKATELAGIESGFDLSPLPAKR